MEIMLYVIGTGVSVFGIVMATIYFYEKFRNPDYVYHQDIKNKKNNGSSENVLMPPDAPHGRTIKKPRKPLNLNPFRRKKKEE